MALTFSIEDITPEMATEWLAHNPVNRYQSKNRIRALEMSMQRGEWRLNGETIKFNCNGDLIDGQHRLAAIVRTGMTIRSAVARGVSHVDQKTIDIGKARTLGDILALHGERSATQLAAAIRIVHAYEISGTPVPGLLHPYLRLITPTLGLEVLDRHQGLRERTARRREAVGLPSSVMCAFGYIFSWADETDADAFIDGLVTGDAPQTSAITILRERFIRELRAGNPHQRQEAQRAALMIRAFNHWRAGTPVSKLTAWRGGGARPEQFPHVVDTTFPFRIVSPSGE